jgi:hypothetical protein
MYRIKQILGGTLRSREYERQRAGHIAVTADKLATKTDTLTLSDGQMIVLNKLVTHSELRRCYKLCYEWESSPDPELRKFAAIARESLKFVKVIHEKDTGNVSLQKVDPPWNDPTWKAKWEQRLTESSRTQEDREDETGWRNQITGKIKQLQ